MANLCCSAFSTTTPWTDCAALCIANASVGFTGVGTDSSIWTFLGGDPCDSANWFENSTAVLSIVERPFQIVGSAIEATNEDSVPNAASIFHTGNVVIGDISGDVGIVFTVKGETSLGANDHTIAGTYASALSGTGHIISGTNSIAAGNDNTVSGQNSVAFGSTNIVDANTSIATGLSNEINDSYASAIIGGHDNVIAVDSGETSIIIGGNTSIIDVNSDTTHNVIINGGDNQILSTFSGFAGNTIIGYGANRITGATYGAIAIGNAATSAHNNAFVFATGTAFTSIIDNEFAVNATGGFRFYNDATQLTGWTSAPGVNGITATSSRKIKENITNLDVTGVAKRFAQLEIGRYKNIKPEFKELDLPKQVQGEERRKIQEEAKAKHDATIYPDQYGIIAESFNSTFSDFFDPKQNNGYDAINILDAIGILSAAIRDLSNEIEILKQNKK